VNDEHALTPAPRVARRKARAFVAVWSAAVLATCTAFVAELSLRGKTLALGYELGRARSEEIRLREVRRVLEVESSSYKTPERVEVVARTLLGMEQPGRDRVIPLGPIPGPHQGAVARSPRPAASSGSGEK
jgi:cell division protein FtsL